MTDERSNLLSFLSVRERMQTGGAGKAVSIVPEKYSWAHINKEGCGDLPAFHAQTRGYLTTTGMSEKHWVT